MTNPTKNQHAQSWTSSIGFLAALRTIGADGVLAMSTGINPTPKIHYYPARLHRFVKQTGKNLQQSLGLNHDAPLDFAAYVYAIAVVDSYLIQHHLVRN